MGCDIHIYTEIKRKNKWVHSDDVIVNDCGWVSANEIIDDRDYNLFALLADVRNRGTVLPISHPKGLPDDVSDSIKIISDQWGCDGHSHSYLTYTELLNAFEDNKEVRMTGLINESQVEDLKNGILPDSWCQGTNQSGYTRHYWTDKNHTFIKLMDELKKKFISEGVDLADNLRIVFFFDN